MGIIFSSFSKSKELLEPFTHKHKIKGLEIVRGPIEKNKFIILDDDFTSEMHPIKFRYNTENNDDWQWEWTPHPDENIWYSVKDEYYEIPVFDLKRYPYHIIVDRDKMIPVKLTIHDNDNNGDDNKYEDKDDELASDPSSPYSFDPKTPRFQIPLPTKYDVIRTILSKKDPIPPHILNQHNLGTNAYIQVMQSGLSNATILKCRFATKNLGSGNGIASQLKKHPILMFFEHEPNKIDDVVWVLHLIKDTRTMKAAVEFDPKLWKKFCRHGSWEVSNKIVAIDESISLLGIAKWCVQYEQKHQDYTELYNNCRKFMFELSQYINVNWDEIMLMEKIWYTALPEDDSYAYKCFSG